jgi:hypothetical protein
MSDFGHTYQDEPVPECDCQRCAIATRDALRAEVERLRELLTACASVCERINVQDGGILGGVNFWALGAAIDAALTPAEATK